MEHAALLQGLTDQEILLFQAEYHNRKRSRAIGFALNLFAGMVGAHQLYLGRLGIAIVYVLLSFAFGLSLIIAIINLFGIAEQVRMYNVKIAQEIVTEIRSLRDRERR